jgi:hypothetical protein
VLSAIECRLRTCFADFNFGQNPPPDWKWGLTQNTGNAVLWLGLMTYFGGNPGS